AEAGGVCCGLFSRSPPRAATVTAELLWRGQFLSRLALPVLGRAEFVGGLRLQMPTLAVCLGEQTVACQTFVSTQCRGVIASALLSAANSLAPVADLNLHVEFRSEPGNTVLTLPVQL